MRLAAAVLLLAVPGTLLAQDKAAEAVNQDYVQPVLSQIGDAAKQAADPNQTGAPAPPNFPNPAQGQKLDYAKKKLVDPLAEEAGANVLDAAKVLGSPDADGSALTEKAFNVPAAAKARMQGEIEEISSEALKPPPDKSLKPRKAKAAKGLKSKKKLAKPESRPSQTPAP